MLEYLLGAILSGWGTLLCFFILLWYMWIYSMRRPENYPPGPRGIPILGVVPFLSLRSEKNFTEWRKKYGDIIGFKIGKQHTVVLNSYDVIQEALVKNGSQFSHRPNNPVIIEFIHKKGISMNDYTPNFIIERKFVRTALGRIGIGETSVEDRIIDEVRHFVTHLGDNDVELNEETKSKMMNVTANVIAQFCIGKRYDYDDKEFNNFLGGYYAFFKTGALAFLATLVSPWLRYIPPVSWSAVAMRDGLKTVNKVAADEVESHEQTLDPKSPRDFIDEYLSEIARKSDPKSDLFTKDMLIHMVRDLFGAGMETAQGTLIFSCLMLANRPEMMKRVHDEIDEVVGTDGKPHYALREKMVFCDAFTKEVMRCRTVVPLAVPHCTSEKVEFRGYTIPKGTTVLPNLHAVHNDPENWDEPEKFNPDRHIGPDGKLNLSKYFMPFGMGPRLCIGRHLAEMEVFIMFVTIFQHFEMIPTPSRKCKRPWVVEDSNSTGITLNPPNHTPVTFVRRRCE